MRDANEAEAQVISSSPVEVNDDELAFEDLSGHSSSLTSVNSCHFNPNRSKHSIVFNIILLRMFVGDLIICMKYTDTVRRRI